LKTHDLFPINEKKKKSVFSEEATVTKRNSLFSPYGRGNTQ